MRACVRPSVPASASFRPFLPADTPHAGFAKSLLEEFWSLSNDSSHSLAAAGNGGNGVSNSHQSAAPLFRMLELKKKKKKEEEVDREKMA